MYENIPVAFFPFSSFLSSRSRMRADYWNIKTFTPSKVGTGDAESQADEMPEARLKPAPPHDCLSSSMPRYISSEPSALIPAVI